MRSTRLALACALCALCACAEDTDPGNLVLPFQLGNGSLSCADAGIVSVRATLNDDFAEAEADCDDDEVRFDSIEAGEYRADVYGIDDNGVVVMDNGNEPLTGVEVLGDGSTSTGPTARLTWSPADLAVRWTFGFGSCDSANIASFRVDAIVDPGADPLLSTELDCELDGEGGEGYRTIEDPDREIDGDTVTEVDVQPLDDAGVPVGDLLIYTFDPPGPGYPIRVTMECDDGGCEGSGEPD